MGTYRLAVSAIEAERERFDRARALVDAGETEEARRVWWWPANEDPPKEHWSRKKLPACSCGQRSPDGSLGLCGHCKGTTSSTPEILRS